MVIIAIITGLIALFGGLYWLTTKLRNDSWNPEGNFVGAVLFWVFGVIWVLAFFGCMHLSWTTNTLTGFIYSADTTKGYTTGHIRFSEQAGEDVQPSFCVKADSAPGRQITELAGSGKKVKITISPYFYFTNNPFACGTTNMTIREVK